MKTKIVRIGNSQGVRIPKPLLREAGLDGNVNLRVEDGAIVIEAARKPREGWAEAAEVAAANQDDTLLDAPLATAFDDEEWTWE